MSAPSACAAARSALTTSPPRHSVIRRRSPSPALARRLQVVEDDNPDPNALLPQRVEIDLAEGRTVVRSVEAVLGSPVRPLTADAMRGKFEVCWRAVFELPLDQGEALWNG